MRESDPLSRKSGYLSQRFSLYGDLSIDENIADAPIQRERHTERDRRGLCGTRK